MKPSGTITFLFTDIEGSSRLWEKNPEAMSVALARHDELLNRIISEYRGYVFKTVGDAFCAAFDAPQAALEAALMIQRALRDETWGETGPLKVRIALHTGTAEERNGDYFGPTLNRIARILPIGYGGQTLLSQATEELVRLRLPAEASLRDLGECHLKDLVRPERIFQLIVPDLPATFPYLKSLDNLPNNLPVQVTSFVGREREIGEVKRLLSGSHLLTLTGSGGAGKTRLSLQVAADLLEEFPDGVWFVELAPLTNPALVPQAAATVLNLPEEKGRPVLATLLSYLRDKKTLLILDNCEHLIEAAAELASNLIRNCPRIRLLASSREVMGIAGEVNFRVPSLSLPPINREQLLPENFTQYEAVQLFVDRALTVQPSFEITESNAPAIAQVCRSLDGIPLAIELAAALVKVLKVEQIATRLDQRFQLLTGGSRTALPRQKTLRALIDWSYDLLSEQERLLLGRLAVFVSGWTLEAAEEVCQGDGIEDYEVLTILTRLVDKSLVVSETLDGQNEGARYRLLETIREYMLEKLTEATEKELPHRRHADYYVKLAEAAESQLSGAEQTTWLNRLETEHDNLRAALDYLLKTGREQVESRENDETKPHSKAKILKIKQMAQQEDFSDPAELALRLSSALVPFWYIHGHEGRHWLREALANSQPQATPGRANALNGAGALAWAQGDYEQARTFYRASLAAWRELGDKNGIASALINLGNVAYARTDYALSQTFYEESLALRRELNDKWGVAAALNNLAAVAKVQSDYSRAMALFEESLALKRELGDLGGVAQTLNNLGAIARDQGDYSHATALLEEGLSLFRQMGNKRGIALALDHLGGVAFEQGQFERALELHQETLALWRELSNRQGIAAAMRMLAEDWRARGDYPQSRQLFNEALKIYRELGQKQEMVECLNSLAKVAWHQGDYGQAEALYNQSLLLHREIGDKRSVATSLRNLGRVAQYQGDYSRATRLYQESLDLSYEIGYWIGIASCLTRLAEVAGARGRFERAGRLFGAAQQLRETIGAPLPPAKILRFERRVATRSRHFDKNTYNLAQSEGRGLLLEKAISYALEEA